MAGPPRIVSAGDQWPSHEERFLVEYVDLEGDPTGTTAGATVVYKPLFGHLVPIGARPWVGAWASGNATAGVSYVVTGDGSTATPWVITLATTGALAAGKRTGFPLRVVFLPGPG